MKDNRALKKILDQVAAALSDAGAITTDAQPVVEVLKKNLTNDDVNLVLHGVQRNRFYLFHNDRAKDFYGFESNDNTAMNIGFYLKVMHPKTYHQLIQAQQFFAQGDRDYFEMSYLLRNAEGKYEKITGVTKTILWDEKGKALYALEATVQTDQLGYLEVLMHCSAESLGSRQKECLMLLVKGHSYGEMADRLGISVKTVEKHVGGIYEVCSVSSRAELLRLI